MLRGSGLNLKICNYIRDVCCSCFFRGNNEETSVLVLLKVTLSDPENVPLHHGNDIAAGTGFAMGRARY